MNFWKWSAKFSMPAHFLKRTMLAFNHLKMGKWNFPGGPVVRTPCFHCRAMGLIPVGGT